MKKFNSSYQKLKSEISLLEEEINNLKNELSAKEGFRILSAYELETDVKVWVITEWDRIVTTILLPDEY